MGKAHKKNIERIIKLLKACLKSDDYPTFGADKRVNAKQDKPAHVAPTKAPAVSPAVNPKPKKSAKDIRGKLVRSQVDEIADLIKAYERRDDYTMVDPREYYGALQAVSSTVLGWIVNLTKNMKSGDIIETDLPIDGAKIKVRKITSDMYSGHLIDKTGEINHLYDRLTIPALASQVMSIYELYDDKANGGLHALKNELESLKTQMQSAEAAKDMKAIEEKLHWVVEKLNVINDLMVETKKDVDALKQVEVAEHVEEDQDKIREKLNLLRDKITPEPLALAEEGIAETVVAQKIGEPGICPDCGMADCKCYTHLTRPSVTIEPNGRILIKFDQDWQSLDKSNFLKSMKMVVARKQSAK